MTVGARLVDAVNTGTSLVADLDVAGLHFTTTPTPETDGLEWRDQERRQLEQRLTWVSLASEWGLAAASVVRLGVVWRFGSQDAGHRRNVRDAALYAEADSIGLGQKFRATGWFTDAPNVSPGGIGELCAVMELEHFYLQRLEGTHRFDILIRGDGSGEIGSLPGI